LSLALSLLLSAQGFSATAFASPAPAATPSPDLAAKQAQQAQVMSELQQMRVDLALSLDDYVTVAKQILSTQQEIDALDIQIADLDASLLASQRELANRAVALYRNQRVTMLEMLLTSRSLQDLITRAEYLSRISRRDAQLIDDIRLTRQESAWLQSQLEEKMAKLTGLQQTADAQREMIEGKIADKETRVAQLQSEIAALNAAGIGLFGGGKPIGGFSPTTVVSEASFRASTAMNAEQIQTFLEKQPGSLAHYQALDHSGKPATAAQMIAEASQAWGVNPAIILVTLQKEQSLLQRSNPSQNAYDWAMGCGKADSRTFTQYRGFGKQIWFGAQKLQQNSSPWKPGVVMKIDGESVSPSNSPTYSLYKYTPHFHGVTRFWLLYWRYFGDPLR
jgi:peptidoglycan hydrolase CwlO-like protein